MLGEISNKFKIGFIGQGWIGKNYADNFEKRGFEVARYSLELPYLKNKDEIKNCDIVFIAVPTPTKLGFSDDEAVRDALKLVGEGKIAVIKSTILPNRTKIIQSENPNIFVIHSPEFLTEATACHDATNPHRNIIGIPIDNEIYKQKALEVLSTLPKAKYSKICDSTEAELIKYGKNCAGYIRIIFTNLLYELASNLGVNWDTIQEAISADPENGPTYMNPIHKSGRGAGGHCFIKDFSAFVNLYEEIVGDSLGLEVLKANENKNLDLLINSQKDLDLLVEVYNKDKEKESLPYYGHYRVEN